MKIDDILRENRKGKARIIIKRINRCIGLIEKDEFTIDDLIQAMKKYHPRMVPETRALIQYLKWPKINAERTKDNGKYQKINQ